MGNDSDNVYILEKEIKEWRGVERNFIGVVFWVVVVVFVVFWLLIFNEFRIVSIIYKMSLKIIYI